VAVGIQGERGSNSARAVELLKGPTAAIESFRTFAQVFEALGGGVDEVVVPLQNSIAGLVTEVADGLLNAERLSIRAQIILPIEFVLAVLPGQRPHVRRVLAHPVAAAQCGQFLSSTEWEIVPCHDTAGAARLVRESKEGSIAALCPPTAAQMYALEVAHTGCTDTMHSATRFLLVDAKPPAPGEADDRTLVSLRAGTSAAAAFSRIAAAGLDVVSVHSRPIPSQPFVSTMLLELNCGAQSPAFEALRAALGEALRLLGSFHS
jgi:prephenate dehydratase